MTDVDGRHVAAATIDDDVFGGDRKTMRALDARERQPARRRGGLSAQARARFGSKPFRAAMGTRADHQAAAIAAAVEEPVD
jgi:hypothetical protein